MFMDPQTIAAIGSAIAAVGTLLVGTAAIVRAFRRRT